jgi:LysR family hydrogen peroxide-inducible transcriptional activator
MTLTELRYIAMLARERHFGRAAEKCNVSQPTLSVALKKFEERQKVILFERSSAEVRLTPIGELVAAQAERVLEEAVKLKELTAQAQDPLTGPLRLGVIYTIAPYLLPQLIPALHSMAPCMPIYLQENFTVRLAEQLRRGDLDAIIIALPFSEPGVVSRAIYDEPFCVVMPAGHQLSGQTKVSPDQIAAENLLLLGNGNCFRDQVVQSCPRLSQEQGVAGSLEGSSLETVRHMVASGAGISVVPLSAAESWPQNEPLLDFRRFTDPAPFRRVAIAWRASFTRPRAIDVLRASIIAKPPAGVSIIP